MLLKKERSPIVVCFILAVYMALFLNLGFLIRVMDIYANTNSISNTMLLTVPVALIAALNILLLPFSARAVLKPAFIFILLTASLFNYGMYAYGAVFDKNMFTNIAQTDIGESSSYFSAHFVYFFLATGVLPALLVGLLRLRRDHFKTTVRNYALSVVLSVLALAAIGGVYYQDYVAVGRNNIALRKSINPSYPYKQVYNYLYETYFYTAPPYQTIAADAQIAPKKEARKKLVILALGETQRSMNYSLNGYTRDTNPYLSAYPVASFKSVLSYGTSTAVSVPYIFSLATDRYNNSRAEMNRDNVLDALQRAGVHTEWLDNDGGCKGVCKNISYTDLRKKYAGNKALCPYQGSCFDSVFIEELKEKLAALPDQDTVLALHFMGSHGPSYWQRYPADFRTFTPDCPQNDIQNCTQEALINTYDNSILFADYVMAEIVKLAQEKAPNYDIAFIFLSDHGESLGESGLYLHGLPKSIAPHEQRSVPLIAWMSDSFLKTEDISPTCLQRAADIRHISNANIAQSLLGLLHVKTSAYHAPDDYFQPCRKDFMVAHKTL
jgi:lipid A ethanolaminephosphotransferase